MDTIVMNHLKKKPNLDDFVNDVIEDSILLELLFEIVSTDQSSIKYACSKMIRKISETRPDIIYPYFEVISHWLTHKNSFIKWDGILTLSNLAKVDVEDKFNLIYKDYFSLVQDPQMITAANVIGNAWKIVLAKPECENDISHRLLEVPDITYLYKGEISPECNYIVCGNVLESFDQYYDVSNNKEVMI